MSRAAELIQDGFGFGSACVFLVDESGEYAVLRASTGGGGQEMGEAGHKLGVDSESTIGWSVANAKPRVTADVASDAAPSDSLRLPTTCSEAVLPLVSRGRCIGALAVRSDGETTFPEEDVPVLQTISDHLAVGIENARLYEAAQREIAERKRAEESLQQRNQELALLNRTAQALIPSVDLDEALGTMLQEVRRLMGVVACSAWLIDPETEELLCRQAVGPGSEIARGWHLGPGEGIAGCVAHSGESLIVPDLRADERHSEGIYQLTGSAAISAVTVPMRVRDEMVGVLQVADAEVGRFDETHLALLEPLAATAAMSIENARLYEQVRQDAATKSVLLREVNHRVKNNLSAIIGLIYAALRRPPAEDQYTYESVMKDLISRVEGLVTVHILLSASEWAPLPLGELASLVIRSSLLTRSPDAHVSVDVSPSLVRVTPDQAHSLALVINELATNTVKHALRGRQTVYVTVSIDVDGDVVLFEFRDDGPGYPEEVLRAKRSNMGLDLIRNVVRKNLQGELSLHNDGGAVAVLRFETKVKETGGNGG